MLLNKIRKKEKKIEKEKLFSFGIDPQTFRLRGEVQSISPQLY